MTFFCIKTFILKYLFKIIILIYFRSLKKNKDNYSDELAKNKPKIDTNEKYDSELSNSPANNVTNKNPDVDPNKPMSSSKPKNEIDSTSFEEVPIEIDDEEPTESSNSSNVLTKISIIDPRKMMDDDNYIRYINAFLDKKPPITYVETVKSTLNENCNLIEMYYTKN